MPLSQLSSPYAVQKAIEECDRLGRDQFLNRYGFGFAREYVLRYNGSEYDSKAIAGVAHKYQFSDLGQLQAAHFSGGTGPRAAATKLFELGYDIDGMIPDEIDWTLGECQLVCKAYFECLAKRQHQIHFVRAKIYRELVPELRNRTEDAVDRKFYNIDAILQEEGLPRLGVAVQANYQHLLRLVVLDCVAQAPMSEYEVPKVPDKNPRDAFVEPPEPPPSVGKSKKSQPKKTDFAKRDAENRRLGRQGEEWVLNLEKQKLVEAGRSDLADKVRWVSQVLGDGAGYDISSFEDTGIEIFVEVKTTTHDAKTEFYVSPNELDAADSRGEAYKLYRLFDFPADPKIYILCGPLERKLRLRSTCYAALPK